MVQSSSVYCVKANKKEKKIITQPKIQPTDLKSENGGKLLLAAALRLPMNADTLHSERAAYRA